MTLSRTRVLARSRWPLAIAALTTLGACASLDPAADKRPAAQARAEVAPARAPGDLPGVRRCMDNLLLDYGARDLSVIVEDLVDPTRRVTAGTRDMLVASVSDMTQRSRAIRLVASDKDWGKTLSRMNPAGGRETIAALPQYALRGSIGAPDGAKSVASSFSLDLTLLTTQDMSVVPGTGSRNSVTLFEPGAGVEGRAEIRKFGVPFVVPIRAGEGQSQALRALVDLSTIELFGRLAKVPYWSCFGASASDEPVASEIQDWYDAMAARPAEIISFFQQQLRTRRLYDGPLDGGVNPQLKETVARYREALGLSREPKLSLDFFKAYLGADHHQVQARLAAAPAVATPVAIGAAGTAPLALHIAAGDDGHRFARGEPVQLMIRPNRDAHVYCYLQDEDRRIVRFFPNRFQRDSRVQPAAGLQLPGAMRFEIVLKPRGVPQTVACFATEHDVLAQLPSTLNAGDFDTLAATTLDQVRSAFVKVSGGSLAQESLQIRPK